MAGHAQPDVVALQEIKLVDEEFPHASLSALVTEPVVSGQKTYNGVALLTRARSADPMS
jgi:exodeoxyribonuclease-3